MLPHGDGLTEKSSHFKYLLICAFGGDLHHASIMDGVFEDFFTHRFSRRGSNVIDDYLDHRA